MAYGNNGKTPVPLYFRTITSDFHLHNRAREFKDKSENQQIAHLKKFLSDLGMTGRMTLEQAKSIRNKRELQDELGKFLRFGVSDLPIDNQISPVTWIDRDKLSISRRSDQVRKS